MIELLLEPAKFFARKKDERPRPWIAYLYVLAATTFGMLASQLAERNLPPPPGLGGSLQWLILGIGTVIASLVVWGLLGFVIHLLTGLGARAFELAGWAFAPAVVTSLVAVAVAAVFPIQASVPPPPADPAELRDWMKTYQAAVQHSTFYQANRILGLLGNLWSAALLYLGTKTFAEKRAALVAGVYLAFTLGLFLWGLIRGWA